MVVLLTNTFFAYIFKVIVAPMNLMLISNYKAYILDKSKNTVGVMIIDSLVIDTWKHKLQIWQRKTYEHEFGALI